MVERSDQFLQRRVAGYHDIRLDGLTDLVTRARGLSVMDIGCNRGLVSFEFANNGATACSGCDNFPEGIATARELFADLRNVKSQFEVVDLSKGPEAMLPFAGKWDILLLLATYHKLKRIMTPELLSALVRLWANRTNKYFAWRGTSDKPADNEQELINLDRDLAACRFKRIHTSYISESLGVACVWSR